MSYIGIPPFGQTVRTVVELVATGGQTSFVITGGYLPGYIDVELNGQPLRSSDFTATDGANVVLTVAANANDEFKSTAYWPVSLVDTYRKSEADGKFFPYTGGNVQGSLGINTTPQSRLHLKQASNGSWYSGMAIENSVNDSRLVGYFDAGQDAWVVSATYGSTGAYKPVTIWTSDTKRVTVDAAGLVTLHAGQLKFPATQNPSSDANTLDDYEEGTWAPTISNWGGTYAGQQGFYTKVGRQVTVFGRVTTNGGSGSWTANQFPNLSSLPFASQSVASTAVQGVWGFSNGVTGLASPNIGAGTFDGPQNGGTSAFPNMFRVGDNIGNFSTNNLSNSVNCEMRFQLTYFTA